MTLRVALVQMTSSDQPEENAATAERMIRDAAGQGATLIATPEVTNCLSNSRADQHERLHAEGDDPTLARMRDTARDLGVTVLLGSLALKGAEDGRFHNRSLLVGPDGAILARYDKIHMFDVDVDAENTFRESNAYAPGSRAVVVRAAGTTLGLTICYDMRFPALHRALALAGAEVLTAPAAFTVPTGRAHWEVLLRARAIETGSYVIAPAQCGTHPGSGRRTWGHSLVVSPWGEVLADGGEAPGLVLADLDLAAVAKARAAIPALANAREFDAPSRP